LRRNEDLFGSRINLSRNDTQEVEHRPDHHHAGQDKIPRILHQTCPNETIPAEWVYPKGSCKEAYICF
jgi:mannosyltransferase OCH1-like enzyme